MLALVLCNCSVAVAQVSGFGGTWTLNGANGTGYNANTAPATGTSSSPSLTSTTAQLLPNQGFSGAVSSIFYNSQQAITAFNASFIYQAVGGSSIGDGAAFVIQSSSVKAIGNQGGNGETSLPASFATAFDYNSSTPGNDFIINGASPVYSTTGSLSLANNQHPIKVTLSYNTITLYETITDTVTGATYSTFKNVDINAIVGGQTAFIGFTAGSSANFAGVTISNFTFTPVTIPGLQFISKPIVPNGWGSCVAPNGFGGDDYQQTGTYGDEYFSPSQQAQFVASGMTLIRADLTWNNVEFSKGVYNWSYYDGLVNNLAGTGVKVMFILDYTNSIYPGNIYQQPALGGYANFAAAAATHFQGKNVFFEIWNEPNYGYSGSQYSTFATATEQAMRAANPNVTIIGPAEGELDPVWREAMLSTGGGSSLNAYSVHPYVYYPESILFSNGFQGGFPGVTADLVTYLPSTGVPLPMMASEGGIAGDTLPHQASFYARTYLTDQLYGLALNTVYKYQDETPTDNTPGNNEYGLIYANNTPKPAFTAVQDLISKLRGYEQIGSIMTGSNSLFVSVYQKGTSLAEAIFSSNSPNDSALPFIHFITTGSAEYTQILNAVQANSPAVIAPPSFPTQFVVNVPNGANGVAHGVPFQFTVTALDEYNNVSTSYNGTVHFTSTDPAAVLPADGTLTNGVGTFTATLNTAAYEYVTATDTVTPSITNAYGLVSGTPSLSVTAASSAVTANDGTSVQDVISLTYQDGYSPGSNTTLSVSGVPAGVVATLMPNSITGSTTSALTFTVSTTARQGTYPIVVTAVNGSNSPSVNVTLTIGAGNTLATDSYLAVGQYIVSPNGICYLIQQASGDLVLFAGSGPSNQGKQIWASNATGTGGNFYTHMQTDGNLVTCPGATPANNNGAPAIWASGTYTGSNYVATVLDTQVVQVLSGTTVEWQEPANGVPTFLVSDSASTMTVNDGTSGGSTLTVSYLSGFTGNVALSAAGLPTGVTASFSPTSVSAAGTSTMTLTVAPNAPIGTSSFTINAVSGSTTRALTIPLTINAGSTLANNTFLAVGQYLVSPAGTCFLIAQPNGNLALFSGSGPGNQLSTTPIWASNQNKGTGSYYTIMQTDGNLVTYVGPYPNQNPIWSSATYTGNSSYTLSVLNSEVIQILSGTQVIWQEPANVPQLLSAASVQVHAGTKYSIALPLTGDSGVECRAINGSLQLVMTFDQAVTASAEVAAGSASISGTPVFSGNTMTVNLSNVTDQQNLTVTVYSVNGTGVAFDINIGVLEGDVNGDGVVSSQDLTAVRNSVGNQSGNGPFAPADDINEDGTINSQDLVLIRNRVGNQLP